jgi:hypothetical protein
LILPTGGITGPLKRLRVSLLILSALVSVTWTSPARGATPAQIDAAIAKGKAYLYSLQKNGTWDEGPPPGKNISSAEARAVGGGQYTGPTALAVYALLACGDKPHQEPRLARAVEFLKKTPTSGVYALGLRCQVWLHLPQTPDVQAAMRRDAEVLINSVKTEGNARGMYDYVPARGNGRTYSHSRAQYGVLGVWAAERSGAVKVPDGYWQVVEQAWLRNQDPSGGWTYTHPKDTEFPATPGMTAAAIATLFITQDYVHRDDGLACRGNVGNAAIEKGLRWMADHMDKVATDEKYPRDFPFPTLYAVERIGLAGGQKYLGKVDWYQKGADWLLPRQGKSGVWTGGGTPGGTLAETAFAMLFLARGRAPVAFNKLDYAGNVAGDKAPPWNQRPRDVANVTSWIGVKVEQALNWQIVNLQSPAEDLLEAPVLYVSGNKPLDLDAAAKAKLREYVQSGGLIVGHADCSAAPFSVGFRKLAAELFPAYEFRELPPDHPIYTGNFPRSKWRAKPSVLGLSNGARELMLLLPAMDPGRVWQTRVYNGKEEFWQLPAAIFLYTTESRDLRFRGETHWVAADVKVTPSKSLKVFRLQYAGNWDPEPAGWRRTANVARNEYGLGLTVETAKLGDGKLGVAGAAGPALAHLTGTAKFAPSEQAKAELKKFVESGGTLLVDAAGGSSAFAGQVEPLLAGMFPAAPLTPLLPGHRLYATVAGEGGGASVRYRPYAMKTAQGLTRSPRLQGITLNGRLAVIYSREDLSVGMVGQTVDGIYGYDAESATELTGAVLAHTASITAKRAGPTTKTSTTTPATKSTTRGSRGSSEEPDASKSARLPAGL